MMGLNKDADASLNDINLVDGHENPSDSVSSIAWMPNPNVHKFACSDWGSKIRVYETVVESLQQIRVLQKACFDTEDPCLSVDWSDYGSKIFAGCIKGTVKAYDINTGKPVTLGQHDAGVIGVHWISATNNVCSLSFDKTMRFWDLRQQEPVAVYNLGLKVFCSSLNEKDHNPNMAIGLQDEKILVVNIPNIQQMLEKNPLDYIDSPLGKGSQISAIEFFVDGSGLGVASQDGRINLSKVVTDAMDKPKLANIMTFKAHKTEQQGSQPQRLYPVNAIGFHPKSKCFVFTAGGEGNMTFWDYHRKNKITDFAYKSAPVTRAKMSPDGLLLAYSLGYDYARGIEGYLSQSHKTKVCVHMMREEELMYC